MIGSPAGDTESHAKIRSGREPMTGSRRDLEFARSHGAAVRGQPWNAYQELMRSRSDWNQAKAARAVDRRRRRPDARLSDDRSAGHRRTGQTGAV
jgi:hypothetical protein